VEIRDPDDWYNVSFAQLQRHGSLRAIKSRGGLGEALTAAYPNIPWRIDKFAAGIGGMKSSEA
jgi:hypothetical protein